MITKPLLIALSVLSLALAGVVVLWQGERGARRQLAAEKAVLIDQARNAERARGIADMRAAEIERTLATHRAAIAALSTEDIPDADLDPGVVAVLCSVRPDDPACAD